jgi:hypothetical protein
MTAPGAGQAEPAAPAQAAETRRVVPDTGIGGSPVSAPGIALLAFVLLGLLAFAVYCLIAVWPVNPAATRAAVSHVAGLRLALDQEQRLFVVVAVTGTLGGLIHSARSLYEYVGDRRLLRSWLLFYLSLPFMGGGLAVLFYLILRGGLVTGAASQVNFFGFAAISALVGLFTPEAALKLKLIFGTLLAQAQPGEDSLPQHRDSRR